MFMIGTFSWAISYVYGVVKGNIFSVMMFFFQAFIGGFVAIVVNEFIPKDWDVRIWLIFLCGFLWVKILDVVDKRGINILLKKFVNEDVPKPKDVW